MPREVFVINQTEGGEQALEKTECTPTRGHATRDANQPANLFAPDAGASVVDADDRGLNEEAPLEMRRATATRQNFAAVIDRAGDKGQHCPAREGKGRGKSDACVCVCV